MLRYWPADTAAFHINASIADAARRYVAATADEAFEAGPGLELLVATARLWRSVGHHDAAGGFRIDGVTGPDEYTALLNNNVYTNLMAARNLRNAADVAVRHPQRAAHLGVDQEEIAGWRDAADATVIPHDHDLGVTAQSEAFTRLRQWAFQMTDSDEYPLLLHFPYHLLYSSQVVKQADLAFALYACGDCFAPRAGRDRVHRPPRPRVQHQGRRPSRLACGQVARRCRRLWWYARSRRHPGLRPATPIPLTRLTFRLVYRGRRLRVDVCSDFVEYVLLDGEPLELTHHGDALTVGPGSPERRSIPSPPRRSAPEQPPGRSPPRRHRET